MYLRVREYMSQKKLPREFRHESLSRRVKGTLRNMPNVVSNFAACTEGFMGS